MTNTFSIILIIFTFFCFRNITLAAPAEQPWLVDPYYLQRIKDINTYPARPQETLFTGDSITEGCDWKAVLHRDDVWGYGIGGDKTFGITHRLSMIAAVKPRQLFILIGVNDIRSGWTIDETIANYKLLLTACKAQLPDTMIYIQSVMPMNFNIHNNEFVTSNDWVVLLNVKIKRLAQQYNYQYIDLYPKMLDQNGMLFASYSDDGLHLNATGHQAWAKLLSPYL
ncbi:MAG: GDSL-type esterase/lipase family protein [Bacillota bacterium]